MGVNPTQAEPTWLTSWTRTLNEPEAGILLDAAVPGDQVDAWAARGEEVLPQASRDRRRELLRIVRDELLDLADGRIVDTAFLRLFRGGSPHRRKGLLWGRLLARRPLVEPALHALIVPALAASDVPLAPLDSDRIDAAAWDTWLRSILRPGIPPEALRKTRTTLQGGLAAVGVLQIEGNAIRITRVTHAEPDPLAWAWTLADELARGGGETDEARALRDSFAARLFGTRREYGMACLEAGISAGLLRRSYLAGIPRLLLGER